MTRRSAGNQQATTTPSMDTPDAMPSIRRRTASGGGGSRLTRIFKGDAEDEIGLLLAGLNDMVVTSKCTSKGVDAQLRGVEALAQWARRSNNCAIDDVMQRTSQLFTMYCEKQMQFTRDFDHFVQQLRKIAETERRVREFEQDVIRKEAKALRIKKQLANGSPFRKKSATEQARLRHERQLAQEELEKAKRRLNAAREEAEVIKMFQFRQGMMGIADSYRNLASNCDIIFGCQREITELVPAVSTQNVGQMLYEGIPYTRDRVEEVRRSLSGAEEFPIVYNPPASRLRVSGCNNGSGGRRQSDRLHGTPPPPYTPTVRSSARMPQRTRFSDSHLTAAENRLEDLRLPVTSHSASRVTTIAPSAPCAMITPVRGTAPLPPQPARLYPDLNALVYPDLSTLAR